MELAVKSQWLSRVTDRGARSQERESDLEQAYREAEARRAKEQHEFRIRRNNLTNPVLNGYIL